MHAFYACCMKPRIPSRLQIAAWHRVSGCGQRHHPDFGFRKYESLKTFKTFRETFILSNQRVTRLFGVYSGEGGEFSGFLGVFAGRPGDSSGRWRSGYGSCAKHGLEHTRLAGVAETTVSRESFREHRRSDLSPRGASCGPSRSRGRQQARPQFRS